MKLSASGIRILYTCCLLVFVQVVQAQADSSWQQKPVVAISGFTDVYYVYDFNRPEGNKRQDFLYNHNRHNEFNLNLGLVKLEVTHARYRANLALQAGTYANDNYAAEPGVLKNIFEANAGVALNRFGSLWLDAGILGSHIGFESALSIDNPTLTRSILAENSPYFLTGARLTYQPAPEWTMAVLVCNGWQRIQRLAGNSLLSFGTKVQYNPDAQTTLNWSTFIGTDDPDTARRIRYFNNLYSQFTLATRLQLTAGFDLGMQQRSKSSRIMDTWLSPVLIARYTLSPQWATALRGEYYRDKTGIIITTASPNGFRSSGLSLNLDYLPAPSLACRLEGRWLHNRDPLFSNNGLSTRNNFALATSIAVRW